uniref:Uncharacterized protein n=1 Tax=Wuchereria bancrofti TaxID=6293 RepID=A0A1I8ED52_WUCBA
MPYNFSSTTTKSR